MSKPSIQVSSFDHGDWHCDIELTGTTGEGYWAGHAELFRNGGFKCRVVLAGRFSDALVASTALERKARNVIDEWDARDHTGDTSYSAL